MIPHLQSIPTALHLARNVYSAIYNGVPIHFAVKSNGQLVYAIALTVDVPTHVMVSRLADILDRADPEDPPLTDRFSGGAGARVLPFARRRA